MQDINKVLVVCNDTDNYRSLAGQLATFLGGTGARLTLMQVIEEPPDRPTMGMLPADLGALVRAHYERKLNDAAAELEEAWLHPATKVVSGKPQLEIVREAAAGGYELVVKSAERQHNGGRPRFGGLDLQLLRTASHPLLVLKQDAAPRLRNLMVAVDVVPSVPEENLLVRKLLAWGKRISRITGATLHVMHAWKAYGESAARQRLQANVVDQYVRDVRNGQWRLLHEALNQIDVDTSTTQVHFHEGEAKRLLPRLVQDAAIDLLVMGTIGRTGIPGFFIGNTAEAVLHEVDASVLAIKPDGFVGLVANESKD